MKYLAGTVMNKSDLMEALARQLDVPVRKSEDIVNTTFDTVASALLSGDRIEIRGFDSFLVREYPGYKARNPKTGELITVAGKKLPFFKAGKELRERVDEK